VDTATASTTEPARSRSRHVAAPTGAAARRRRRPRLPYLLLAPAAAILGLVVGYPLIRLVVISTQGYGLRSLFTGRTTHVGFGNYLAIWHDPDLLAVLVRTAVFAATLVAGTVGIGLAVALLLGEVGRRMRTAMTVCLIGAWAVPNVAATLIWQWLFQPAYGVVNWLVTRLGVFGDYEQHDWLAKPTTAFVVVWLLVVWQSVPFVALTLHAGISQIPGEYHEAAALDGAGYLKRLRIITIPFLRPILLLVTVLSVIWDFTVFNQIWLLTHGGPENGTTTLGVWSFARAFASQSYGQGAAIAVVSVLLLSTLTAFYVRRLVQSGEIN
jgi:N,N'-diacetylchitobiose transport system permease protein